MCVCVCVCVCVGVCVCGGMCVSICACCVCLFQGIFLLLEHTVHQLAEHEVQATSTQFTHWLEGGVQTNGGTSSTHNWEGTI